MGVDYPYVLAPDRFREFVQKLQNVGKPAKVDVKYLKSLGYTSSNDTKFLRPLKFIQLIDPSGVPQDRFRALREKEAGKAKIGSYIKEAYSALYSIHENAHAQDTETLNHFFTANTDVGPRAVEAMVTTFQVLCQFASFEEGAPVVETAVAETVTGEVSTSPREIPGTCAVTINVNIQLAIPPTSDSEIYDKLFSSMAKHIMKFKEG